VSGTRDGTAREHRVLVVEDNASSRRLACEVLELHGYVVEGVETGEEALEVIGERRPDVVLLDVQLPGIDGVETLRRLRSDPQTADLPVVAVTAYAMRGDRDQFLADGFDAYIAKPIDVRALPHQVEAMIEGGAAAG
jgi:two-component system, cell cycle response regulator DivK